MTQRDAATLLDIDLAAERIQDFTADLNFEAFEQNEMVQSAVLYQFNILGEAVTRLSDTFKESHAHIPWRQIRAMRNLVIHVYDGVNLKIVWDVIQQDMSTLRHQLQPLIPQPDP